MTRQEIIAKLVAKYTTYSTAALSKENPHRTDKEQEAINIVLERRKAKLTSTPKAQPTPAKEAQPTPAKEAQPTSTAKPKKARTEIEAQKLLTEARLNRGFVVTVKPFGKNPDPVTGVIVGARLDPRTNFVQYRIKLSDGKVIGKGVDNPDIIIGDCAS